MMSDHERINRLEQLVADLCLALWRKDTTQNGNWGFPGYERELERIGNALTGGKE